MCNIETGMLPLTAKTALISRHGGEALSAKTLLDPVCQALRAQHVSHCSSQNICRIVAFATAWCLAGVLTSQTAGIVCALIIAIMSPWFPVLTAHSDSILDDAASFVPMELCTLEMEA